MHVLNKHICQNYFGQPHLNRIKSHTLAIYFQALLCFDLCLYNVNQINSTQCTTRIK